MWMKMASDDEVKDTVHTWFQLQTKNFFADGIRRLVNHYTINVQNVVIMLRNDTLCTAVHEVLNTFTFLFDSDSH